MTNPTTRYPHMLQAIMVILVCMITPILPTSFLLLFNKLIPPPPRLDLAVEVLLPRITRRIKAPQCLKAHLLPYCPKLTATIRHQLYLLSHAQLVDCRCLVNLSGLLEMFIILIASDVVYVNLHPDCPLFSHDIPIPRTATVLLLRSFSQSKVKMENRILYANVIISDD